MEAYSGNFRPPSEYSTTGDTDYDNLEMPDGYLSDQRDGDQGERIIPFAKVCQNPNERISSRDVFVPNVPVSVRIESWEKTPGASHLRSPYLYTIALEHDTHVWRIRRRYSHFLHLHQQLQFYRATLSIPLPGKDHRERRRSLKMTIRRSANEGQDSGVPRFPKKSDSFVSADEVQKRAHQLERYLEALLTKDVFKYHFVTLKFFEVSQFSFIDQLGPKGKEGLLEKRAGGNCCLRGGKNDSCGCGSSYCCIPFCDCFSRWMTRWFMVKDTWIGYINPRTGLLRGVMLFSLDLHVSHGRGRTGLQISNFSRDMHLKARTRREAYEWMEEIKQTSNRSGREFTQPNRFGSYAPLRPSSHTQWFVDGAPYMTAIADALEGAKEEIMIADWWLTPEIYMKRPAIHGHKWRLDCILKRKAEQGVKVFILLFKEVEFALGINSFYSKQVLASSHPNIKVLRHPDHVKDGVYLSSHHEKIVVVDQTYAFLGGLDLCYGRWDDYKHRLIDLGSVAASANTPKPVRTTSTFEGRPQTLMVLAQATQRLTLSAVASSNGSVTTVESHLSAEAWPVGDVGTQSEDEPYKSACEADESCDPTATTDAENRPEKTPGKRRAIVRKMKTMRERGRTLASDWKRKIRAEQRDSVEGLPQVKSSPGEDLERRGGRRKIQDSDGNGNELGFVGSAKLWIGKDYTNFILKDFNTLEEPFEDLIDRITTPRMPWHDIGIATVGRPARDVSRHFVERWNFVKREKCKNNQNYPYLVPKSYADLPEKIPPWMSRHSQADCQVIRSVSQWSAGVRTEDSIHEAYCTTIRDSKHYIYIENQFFISLAAEDQDVTNKVALALLERITRAHSEGIRFRVYVVMPLLPGFEGEIKENKGTALLAVCHWNYASICRGPKSLMSKLREANIDPSEYITFYGLRNHSELNGQLVSELIYVHSKLMIVDDVTVICGSANINDRSLTGKRDSEVAIVVQDIDFEPSIMDGRPYQCGRFAGSLRKYLFREHLGLLEKDCDPMDLYDPVCDSFYKGTWIRIASLNTKIYEDVFRCVPSDDVTTFMQLKSYRDRVPICISDSRTAKLRLQQVQGHLVLLPLHFLCNENLLPAAGTREALMPTSLWT